MKKLLSLGTILSISILSGCVTTSEDSVNLAEVDFTTLTCEQIETVFKDYKTNVDSGDTMTNLLGTFSSEAESAATTAKATAMTVYNTAKETAEPAIKVKGCDINI